MNFYNKNMQFLQKNYPPLYKEITASLPVYQAETKVLLKTNNVFVKTASAQCYIHSLYDRHRELQKLFADIPPGTQALILFGLGMGDAITYITKHLTTLEHLIVIEPNIEVFKAFLTRIDLVATLQTCPKFSIIFNQTSDATAFALYNFIQHDLYTSLAIVAPLSYRSLYQTYYKSVKTIQKEAMRQTLVNISTRRFANYEWLANEWRNEKVDRINLETIINYLPPLPVILVSAGPSLNKNIHLLPEAKDRAIIIALGSAISTLERHGITPHFRMAYDGLKANKKIFDTVDTTTCALIYSNTLYYEVPLQYRGGKIQFILNTDHISQYFRRKQQKKAMVICSGPTIANVAFDLVCQCGCTKVIFTGQDLCFTGEKLHAAGSWDDAATNNIVSDNLASNTKMILTKDIYDQDVYTTTAFMSMKTVFEDLIKIHSKVQCINASEGGLPISGSQNKTLRQVLDEDLPDRADITALINKALAASKNAAETPPANNIDATETAAAELAEICQINKANLEAIKQIHTMMELNMSSKKILNQLQKIKVNSRKFHRVDYYTNFIQYFLADTIQALHRRLAYAGPDKKNQAVSLLQIYTGEALAMEKLIRFNQALIEEYQGKTVLNIIYK